MKQLYIFIISGMLIGICELVDTAFGNHINIDSVCVLSSFTIITWVAYSIYSIGAYGYRILLKDSKSCLSIQIVVSVVLSIFIYALSSYIPHLFFLTAEQHLLFENVLKTYSLGIVFQATGDYLLQYIKFKYFNKLMFISNIIFYVIMIMFDTLVLLFGYDLSFMIIGTNISYLIYDAIVYKYSKIYKETDKINLKSIQQCLKHGSRIVLDRLFGKVATIVFNIYASRLGTELYAVHCICYAVSAKTENITNCIYDFQISSLNRVSNIKDKFKTCRDNLKKMYVPVSIISFVFGITVLFFIHGVVDLKTCIIYTFIYYSQSLLIQSYESYKGFLSSVKATNYIAFCGLVGVFIRIPIALISYYCGIGLIGFGLASGIDFWFRGLYYKICCNKILLKNEQQHQY